MEAASTADTLCQRTLYGVLCPKLGLLPDRAIDSRPVLLHLVTVTAAPVAACWLDRLAVLAVQSTVPGRLDIPERVGGGPGTCHAKRHLRSRSSTRRTAWRQAGPAVVCLVATQLRGGFIAARPLAQGSGQKIFAA